MTNPAFRYEAEPAVETLITPSRLTPIALWTSTPKATSSGTMIKPPPTPTSAPKTPAPRATAKAMSSRPITSADYGPLRSQGMTEQAQPGPLAGIRVLELSTVLAGPYSGMVLADLGADVIKVEPPDGDATRGYGPPWVEADNERVAAYFLAVNRNKRSLRLDLRQKSGKEILGRLLEKSDVLIENHRPGGLAKLGFDDARLAEINPRLVHLAITGYGADGPDAAKPGYDFIAQAVGGLMSVTGFADADGGQPTKVGVAITDIVTGLLGTVGILAAIHSGVGQRIDVSLLESTLAMLINQAQNAFVNGQSPDRRGNAHPNIVPYETFATADGRDRRGRGQRTAVATPVPRPWS